MSARDERDSIADEDRQVEGHAGDGTTEIDAHESTEHWILRV